MNVLYADINSISSEFVLSSSPLLPAAMETYIKTFSNESDRRHRLLARLMLRHCLIQTTGSDALLLNWKLNSNHKPFIPGWYEFNISHSGRFVVFAYDERVIGVDIEKTDEIDYLSVAEYFHSDEKKHVATSLRQQHDFYAIWTKKEALLKALGTGIGNEMTQFSCLGQSVHYKHQEWFFYPLLIDATYVCYVCSAKDKAAYTVEKFQPLRRATLGPG